MFVLSGEDQSANSLVLPRSQGPKNIIASKQNKKTNNDQVKKIKITCRRDSTISDCVLHQHAALDQNEKRGLNILFFRHIYCILTINSFFKCLLAWHFLVHAAPTSPQGRVYQ